MPRAGLERCRHDVSLAGVDRDRRAARRELADDRHDALDLVAFPHRLGARAGSIRRRRRRSPRPRAAMSAPASAAAAASANCPPSEKLSGVALTMPMTCGWSSRMVRSPSCSGARGPVSACHCAAMSSSKRSSMPSTGTSSVERSLVPFDCRSARPPRTSSARRRAARPCRHGRTANRRRRSGGRSVRMAPRYSADEMLLPQGVERLQRAALLDVPEGPAVARRRALKRRADLVDRARLRAAGDRAVGADRRRPAALGVGQHRPRRDQPAFDQQRRRRRAAASRLSGTVCIALSSSGRVEAIRSRATFT